MNKVIVIAVMFLILCTSGCAKVDAPKPKEVSKAPDTAQGTSNTVEQKVLAFNLEGFTEKGAKKWDIVGESAEAVSESEVRMKNIVAKSYGTQSEAMIVADKGIYDKAKNNVRLENNVRATIEQTESSAKDYLDISGALLGAKKADAAEPPQKKKSKTTITCDGEVQFEYENNLAYFNKNVRVVSDYGEITADKITVNLDAKSKDIRDIVAEGNVKIAKEDNVSFCDKATYIEAEKKVILTGRPKLVVYGDGNIESKFTGK